MAGKDVNIATKEAAAGFTSSHVEWTHLHIPIHGIEGESQAGNEFLGTGFASNDENILIIDCA